MQLSYVPDFYQTATTQVSGEQRRPSHSNNQLTEEQIIDHNECAVGDYKEVHVSKYRWDADVNDGYGQDRCQSADYHATVAATSRRVFCCKEAPVFTVNKQKSRQTEEGKDGVG